MEIADINSTTGLPENNVDVGDIVKDSGVFSTEDGQVTRHFAERKQYAYLVIKEQGIKTLKFQLTDMSADNLVKYLGGTVTAGTGGTPDSLAIPSDIVGIEKAFVVTTDDGSKITIHRGHVYGKVMADVTKRGTWKVDVTVEVLQPNLGGLPPMKFEDYTTVA